jgi:glycosyltransferase involved in cell wall biosynthesis
VIYPEGVHVESYPLVSVVTPSFNQAQFIEETLRSVELQRYRPIHQVVIDGGSTDGTVDLLKRWGERAWTGLYVRVDLRAGSRACGRS